jgi:hypothetical protein
VKLGAATIAQHARDAGFYGDAVPVATAIALSTSGGLTHHRHRAGIPGAGDWRGLWQINVDEHPDLVELDLYDPVMNAWAAHELTTSVGGFGWSAVYRNNWYSSFVDHARVEATREGHKDEATQPYTVHLAQHRITDTFDRLHRHFVGRMPRYG